MYKFDSNHSDMQGSSIVPALIRSFLKKRMAHEALLWHSGVSISDSEEFFSVWKDSH